MESPAHSAAPTPLQQASVARSLLSPKGGHYIQQLVCEWTEPLNLKLWRHAWELVAARHDSLRAYFAWEQQTEILQKFADAVAVLLEPGNITPADRQAVLADFLRADRRRGFDLSTAPVERTGDDHGMDFSPRPAGRTLTRVNLAGSGPPLPRSVDRETARLSAR